MKTSWSAFGLPNQNEEGGLIAPDYWNRLSVESPQAAQAPVGGPLNTTPVLGDIALVGYSADAGGKSLAFVLLADLSGEVINITDNGWTAAGAFRSGEGVFSITIPSGLPIGTVIRVTNLDASPAVPVVTTSTGLTIPASAYTETGDVNPSTTGDQFLVYRGTAASPTFLFALDFADNNTTYAGDATNSNTSAVPTGLTFGTNALAFGFDNGAYTGPLTGTRAQILTNIATASNWTTNDTVVQTYPGSFTVTGGGENQSVVFSPISVVHDEGNSGTTAYAFTVTRSGGTTGDLNFSGTFSNGTTDNADYVGGTAPAATFNGSIPAGQTSATVTINVAGDFTIESNENFSLTLTNVTNTDGTVTPTIGANATATGTITNDDSAGTFSLAGNVSASEAAGGGLVFTVNRANGSTGAATVSYAVTGSGAHPVDAADFGGTLPSGTIDFAEGETSKTITITPTNDSDFEFDETFTLTISNPTQGTIGTGTATGTVTNDDSPPVGSFSLAGDSSALEGAGTITFTVNRTGGSTGAADVSYAVTASGTHAANAADFTGGVLPAGTVSFADGETSKTITIPVANDHDQEFDETFTVTLSNPTNGASLGATTTAIGTIQNDDNAGSFSLAGNQSGSESAGAMTFTVNRTGGSDGAVTLNYAVTGSGAHPANAADFGGTLPSGTVMFADGETSKTITITPSNDSTYESDETFTLTISNPTFGTIGTATATGTITNDEPVPPSLTISDPSVIEGDAGTVTLVYTVTASFPVPAGGLSVDYATADGTATAGSGDYVTQSGTLNFAQGDTTATISVTVNGDTLFERNETVIVNLSNPVNALIADGQGVGTIGNDDPVPPTAGLFSTDFAAFTATGGFAPGGVAGGLDSNIWRVVGLSDIPSPAFGFTAAGGGDFGKGIINGSADPTQAGVYSPSADHALVVQPTGAELDVGGFIEARIQNNSGATATSFDLVFDWVYRNSADRSSNLQLAFSTDGVNFTTVVAAAFSTPTTHDTPTASVFTDQHESLTLTGTVADGGYLYLRWIHASSSGGGSRDEVGIDDVSVTAHLSSTPTATISDISFSEGNSGTSLATFTITRSNGTGAASLDFTTEDVTAVAGSDYVAQSGTINFADGEFSKTVSIVINGDTAHEADETFTLNLSNAVGFVTPVTRATATIVNDDAGPIAIYDIQGLGHVSPFVGQSVTTTGIVTAVDTNGFYLQDPAGDANPATSDGIFVFTSTAPTVAVGDSISVTGTVAEFASSNPDALSITEINSPTISVLSTGNPLPAAVLIGTGGLAIPSTSIDDDHLTSYDPHNDAIDFYESIEGMRVTIKNPSVTSDTDPDGDTYVVASNGATATGLNARGGLTLAPGDTQPERIHIATDSGINPGFTNPHWTQGDQLNDVTGVITYFSQTYQLIPTMAPSLINDISLARETTALHGDVNHLAIATYNLENYDPNDHKEGILANDLIFNMGGPDIIGVEEVQDDNGTGTGVLTAQQNLTNLVNAMNALDPTANYQFVSIAPTTENTSGGEPNGNIRNAFIYDANRVTYVPGSAQLITDVAFANSRLPLVAQFVFNGETITAIDMHSYSRGGSGPDFGDTQPPTISGDDRRTAMGQAVRDWLDAHPQPHVAVMGDFNGYYFEGGLQALQNTNAHGAGLTNLAVALLSPEERYSYQFDGAVELIDHILVSAELAIGAAYDSVHINTEYRSNTSRPTDHDPQVALVFVNAPAVARADDVSTDETTAIANGNVFASNGHGADSDAENDAFSVIAVNGVSGNVGTQFQLVSGATVKLNADGTFSYDPNGAFDYLVSAQTAADTGAANSSATDSFTYTLTGGSSTTVTVTINGVDGAGDHLNGTSGGDGMTGTSDSDYFDLSQGGNDSVSGGDGNDGFFFGAAFTSGDSVDGGDGTNDQIGLQGNYTGPNALTLSTSSIFDIEAIVVLPGYSYDITTVDDNVPAGGLLSIQATQLAAGQSLTFDGSAETDGRFMIYGGQGNDDFTGGAGDDGFYFGPGGFNASDVVNGGGGSNDQLGLDGDYTLTLGGNVTNVEVVVLLHGPAGTPNHFNITADDAFVPIGETRTIFGIEVETSIVFDGSGEHDGAYKIYGGLAADTLTGSDHNDWIFGGNGGDTLTGGAGADTFYYDAATQSTSTGFDRLVGFDDAADKIDLPFAVTGFAGPASGDLSNATFDSQLSSAFAGLTAHQAGMFTATGGDMNGRTFLVIDADGNAGYQAGSDYVMEIVTPPTPVDNPAIFV